MQQPADFMRDNLAINDSVLQNAHDFGVSVSAAGLGLARRVRGLGTARLPGYLPPPQLREAAT